MSLVAPWVGGEVFCWLSKLGELVVLQVDGRKAFEGAIRLSSTALGLNGYKPHFLNPLMIFSNVNDEGQATATSEAKSSTRPGFSAMY